MKHTFSRVISLLLVAAMLVGFIPTLAMRATAAGDETKVEVQDAPATMNLTEIGDVDWIHAGYPTTNRKADADGNAVGILGFETVGAAGIASAAGDVGVLYSYTDGTPASVENKNHAAVISYQNGEYTGEVAEEAGWKITVPAAGEVRQLSFVSGVWNASTEVRVIANGDAENPVYTNSELTAGGSAVVKRYVVTISPNTAIEVYGKLVKKSHAYGNVSMGGITLGKPAEEVELPEVSVDAQNASGTLNLTESGNLDWIYFNGDKANRKGTGADNAAANILQFEEVTKHAGTFSDSPMTYTWGDGAEGCEASGSSRSGIWWDANQTCWRITVPAGEGLRYLTAVPGAWNTSALITVKANGQEVWSTTLTGGGSANVKKIVVTVPADTTVVMEGKKIASGGNTSMAAITLGGQEKDVDYVQLLKDTVKIAEVYAASDNVTTALSNMIEKMNAAKTALENENLTNDEAYPLYVALNAAIGTVENEVLPGRYADSYASGMTGSFGWEGDKDAPIAWIDGSYRLRDNGDARIYFGVTGLGAGSIDWYNAEGYLPCYVSEYEKDGLKHKIENFADLVIIDGNKFEIAYSRMTTTNTTGTEAKLPEVSRKLISLDENNVTTVGAGETVVRTWCVGADRFGGSYAYPSRTVLAAQGSFEEHYEHMKNYWNGRLKNIIDIKDVPEAYAEVVNAYKAGYIYTLIIEDGYQLHVGENGYDRVFDHDVLGIVAALIESGHTENFEDYVPFFQLNPQYPDSKWKTSWPFALYLQKTGDVETIKKYWDTTKSMTHSIETDSEVYDGSILDADGNPARIMKRTNAIDSYGYWTIDNWAALAGLTTYSYLCQKLYEDTSDQAYMDEFDWAKKTYNTILKGTEAVLANTMEKYGFDYIPICMVLPNEESERKDVRDGNWAAHYLFGRWNWDGYLFETEATPRDSWLLDLTDSTYDYVIAQKSTVFDSPYNMGGYPHGYYSSAYNAGYFSAALTGNNWRDGGIQAYRWMIENAMGSPFGWWEGVAYPSNSNPWSRTSAFGGGGSCQHMWGQSTATKVLVDSVLAEKADGSIILGRGIPKDWNAEGETIEISNFLCNAGKRIGFTMSTTGKEITITLTGDEIANPVSVELPVFIGGNLISATEGATVDAENGKVVMAAGVKTVTITVQQSAEDMVASEEALKALKSTIAKYENTDVSGYVTSTGRALTEAIAAAKALLDTDATAEELKAAAAAVETAFNGLVDLVQYNVALDYATGRTKAAQPTFGQKDDQRARYATFKVNEDVTADYVTVWIQKYSGNFPDCLVSIYSLQEDNYTLDTCLGTGRLSPDEIVSGEANIFKLDKTITLEAGNYYAIHFATDHQDTNWCAYWYYAGPFMSDDLYACKVQGNGNVVNENRYGLGTAWMKLSTLISDKTALDAAVEAAPAELADLVAEATEVLLNREATQEEVDAMLAKLTAAMETKYLNVVNGLTGEVTKLTAEELEGVALTELASKLNCLTTTVDGTTYTFAGWFTAPQEEGDFSRETWAANVATQDDLAVENTVYAYYVNAGFLNTTIAYTSNATKATRVYALSTVPGDIFGSYGFALSTAEGANDDTLLVGETLGGLKVKNVAKTTVYSYIAVAPFTAKTTANAFNGALGGANNGDGYLTYAAISNMPVGKTVSARAYYVTLDGTMVYGTTAQTVLAANNAVTGLN